MRSPGGTALTHTLPIVRAESWYHATNRGVSRSILFHTSGEAQAFVEGLGRVAEQFTVEIHSYCVMGNHYHLLARADEEELLRALSDVESGFVGIPAQPRLCRMAFGRHLVKVTRYIHLNPVEAQMVVRPEDWPWSSYRGYLDRLDAPRWLRSDAVLGWLGSIGARQRYRQEVERNMSTPSFSTSNRAPFCRTRRAVR